jgi:UDP-galactopyranose mutase
MHMESTDIIIVGSSIVAMLEATMQARNGKSVVVMEQDDVLGGCWRTMSIPYCTGLNYGSHLFRRNRTCWDFLSKHCNTEFTRLLP